MKMKSMALVIGALIVAHTAAAQEATLKEKAEAVLLKSCVACHDSSMSAAFVDEEGNLLQAAIKAYAEKIIARVSATTRPMPPKAAPAVLQITAEEKADLIAYAKTLLAPPVEPEIVPLSKLKLDSGFKIEVFAKAQGARSLAVHSSGVVFVGTGGFSNVDPQGRVHAIIPGANGKNSVIALASRLNNPNGVAIAGDDLFVAESTRVIVFKNAVDQARRLAAGTLSKATFSVIKDDFRDQGNHHWKYLTVGPDNKLYVPVGADCNVCKEDRENAAGIFRMNLDGSDYEQVAKGVRNTVGMAFHPVSKDLWFSDNGRDSLGDNLPPDELNQLTSPIQDYGFPFCFGKTVKDPTFGGSFTCNEPQFTKPKVDLGAHVAALGIDFYTGSSFPAQYQNAIFIAEHGSWNSSRKVGYRLSIVETKTSLSGVESLEYRPFISGWVDAEGKTNWGRPVDIKNYIDGSMLLSDDASGIVYRISYSN